MAIASDTSGSIRGPAFHCGTVGLKPTYGRVSGRGAQPLSHTLDHFGPLAWTVADAAAALQVIAGGDPDDPRAVDVPVPDYLAELGRGVAGLRVAHSPAWYADDPATMPQISNRIEQALGVLQNSARPSNRSSCRTMSCSTRAGGSSSPPRHSPSTNGTCAITRDRSAGTPTSACMPGAGIGAADLLRAYDIRRRLTRSLDERVFGRYDVLVTACGQTTAARFADFGADWPPPKLANDMQTIPFSVSGHPALSLPLGLSDGGLPIGLQLIGPAFGEGTVFRAAAAIEAALGQRQLRPAVEPEPIRAEA